MSELTQLRVASMAEGVSYVVLLFIAMPLKYVAHDPSWVAFVGRVHGVLFVALVFALARCASARDWGGKRSAVVMLAALVPFGAFWLEPKFAAEARTGDHPARQA
jgi:integral membrane protein